MAMATLHHDDHGSGPALLLLHGFGGSRADWRQLFDPDALAARFRVIAPDLPGHGETGGPCPPRIHRASAAAVLALLDELGIAECAAIGCSMGGNTLLHVATEDRRRLRAMVIAGATPYFPAQARAAMRQVPAAAFMADEHDDVAFTPPLLATIETPTLIVNGDRDPLYPVELSLELHRAIPRSALWVLPMAGHAPIWDAHAPAFAARALAFVEQPGL
jgi:pimeloyl-ACP methyl ester carboxylesterase